MRSSMQAQASFGDALRPQTLSESIVTALVAILLITIVLPSQTLVLAAEPVRDSLDLDGRLAAQAEIEIVYQRHRALPGETTGISMAPDTALSRDALRAKVEDGLAKTEALASLWNRDLSHDELQRELDRITSGTRAPRMLSELWSALDNDPFLIAECLARPALAEREIRSMYARDPLLHATERRQFEEAIRPLTGARIRDSKSLAAIGGITTETRFTRLGPGGIDPANITVTGVVMLDDGEWLDLESRLAGMFPGSDRSKPPLRRIGQVQETGEAFEVTTILSRGARTIVTATVAWPKRSFDVWWSEERGRFLNAFPSTTTRETYAPLPSIVAGPSSGSSATTVSNCPDDTWTPTAAGQNAPAPRRSQTAVWTGAEMIVWGGHGLSGQPLSSGGRYDPALDLWTPTRVDATTPSPRQYHAAVWTGSRMIVWGGSGPSIPTSSGALYDPATDSWQATGTGAGTPSARSFPSAVWTGTEMIVWGGLSGAVRFNSGGRYDPLTNSWRSTSQSGQAPSARSQHSAVWAGGAMIVWGGLNPASQPLQSGGVYDPGTDTWTATSIGTETPRARSWHTAVWTGRRMVVWGGLTPGGITSTGGQYDPVTDSWSPTGSASAPSARWAHSAIWTGDEMIVWGGTGAAIAINSGGRYTAQTDFWKPTSLGAGVPGPRQLHTAVWSGGEMIVWGGSNASGSVLQSGGRYCAATTPCIPTTWYLDADHDGFGDPSLTASSCAQPPGYVANANDCNDADASVHPGAGDAVCNGIDNDCDGSVDENFVPFTSSCGVGACAATGSATCPAGVLVDTCMPGSPMPEVCDTIDNDCDGSTDEGLGSTPTTCGVGACAATGQLACQGGVFRDSCVPKAPSVETCDAVDNDCDGSVDEGLQNLPTTCGAGACAAAGIGNCSNGVFTDTCVPGTPATEICDAMDNDCDGSVDEGLPPQPTICGTGACSSTGQLICQTGVLTDTCIPGTPSTEICNALDDDCDGAVDEGLPQAQTTCGIGACQRTGVNACVGGHFVDSCVPGAPAVEICDGIDNDCDGAIDTLPPPVAAGLPSGPVAAGQLPGHPGGTLTFEDRIAVQRAIEGVFAKHRLERAGPAVNGSGPSEGTIDAALAERVRDTLRETSALQSLWGRAISAPDLQAEIDRMARDTNSPDVLRELFDALGNDTFLIAEGLARPALANRLIRSAYARDAGLHESVRAHAEDALAEAGTIRTSAGLKLLAGRYSEVIWNRDVGDPAQFRDSLQKTPSFVLDQSSWDSLMGRLGHAGLALSPESQFEAGPLEETDEAFAITAVVSRGPDSVHIATVVWPKTPFASWWRQARGGFSDELAIASTSFAPATPAAGCIINTWNATGAGINLPAPRYGQTAVWTGIEMIVWGGYGTGYLSSGGIYVPALDSWSATDESANVPTPRGEHAALWTGTEMIVWGGFDGTSFLNSGARYDLLTNSWTPTGQGANVPSARKGETLVWSGSRMIVWGGFGVTGPTKTGAIYNPLADTWLPVSKTGAPAPRTKHTALWIGTEMVVWGGTDSTGVFNFSSGGRYDPVTDVWRTTSVGSGVPAGRSGHTAVWTGSEMIVWGGFNVAYMNTGGRYDPVADTWIPTANGSGVTPIPRGRHTAVWTGDRMIVWGGFGTGYLNTGGRYDPVLDTWVPTTVGLSAPVPRADHSTVWTGAEMIVWGGNGSAGPESTGGRYCFGQCIAFPWHRDADGDGYGSPTNVLAACLQPAGYVGNGTDCDDSNPAANPGALCDMVCNGVDENCSGVPDEGFLPVATICGIGVCQATGSTACAGGVAIDTCTPGSPGPEICGDGLDNDCDGVVDNGC